MELARRPPARDAADARRSTLTTVPSLPSLARPREPPRGADAHAAPAPAPRATPRDDARTASRPPHACGQCDARFATLADLVAHRAAHRASASASRDDAAARRRRAGPADAASGARFRCGLCGRRFLDAAKFVRHKMTHQRERAEDAVGVGGLARRRERERREETEDAAEEEESASENVFDEREKEKETATDVARTVSGSRPAPSAFAASGDTGGKRTIDPDPSRIEPTIWASASARPVPRLSLIHI